MMISQHMTKAEYTRAKNKEWRDAHRTVHITAESYDALVRWAGRLQAETGAVTGISDALVELIRMVDEHDLKLTHEKRGEQGGGGR